MATEDSVASKLILHVYVLCRCLFFIMTLPFSEDL